MAPDSTSAADRLVKGNALFPKCFFEKRQPTQPQVRKKGQPTNKNKKVLASNFFHFLSYQKNQHKIYFIQLLAPADFDHFDARSWT